MSCDNLPQIVLFLSSVAGGKFMEAYLWAASKFLVFTVVFWVLNRLLTAELWQGIQDWQGWLAQK